MLITPTSVRYEALRAQNIVRMKLDGTVVEGALQPSSEWRMHAAVYKAYPETNAVFHTHSPYATAFAVVRRSIPAVLIEARIFLGGDVRCADYATPGTKEVGMNAVPALFERGGCTLGQPRRACRGGGSCTGYRARNILKMLPSLHVCKAIGEPVVLDTL